MAAPWQQFDVDSDAYRAVVDLAAALGLRIEVARTLMAARRNGTAWIVDPTLRLRVGRAHTLSGLVFDLAAAIRAREVAAENSGSIAAARGVLLSGRSMPTLAADDVASDAATRDQSH